MTEVTTLSLSSLFPPPFSTPSLYLPLSFLPQFLLSFPDQVREMYITFKLCVSHCSDTNVKEEWAIYLCIWSISSHLTLLPVHSPAMAKPPSALASAWGSHTHFSQHSPGTRTLRGMGQSGPGSITSTLQRGTQAICPSRHMHWYLQVGKKVWPF